MTKEEISKARAATAHTLERQEARKGMLSDWFTVALLLVALKTAGAFASGWDSWWIVLFLVLGYVGFGILWIGLKTLFRRR